MERHGQRLHDERTMMKTPPPAAFDYERSLARLGGDPALFREIASLFLEDSPQLIDRARRALVEQQWPEVERASHSLKGLSVNFDAMELASAAAAVERHAHACDAQRVTACFLQMETELARMQQALTEFCHGQAPPPEGG